MIKIDISNYHQKIENLIGLLPFFSRNAISFKHLDCFEANVSLTKHFIILSLLL